MAKRTLLLALTGVLGVQTPRLLAQCGDPGPNLVTIQPVVLAKPSGMDSGALPASAASIALGTSFVVEMWAQQTDTELLGLSCVFSDISFDSTAASCETVTVAPTFDGFGASGSCAADTAIDVGGCTFNLGEGVMPQWVRVATIDMTANVVGSTMVSSALASDPLKSISIVGCGNVASERIQVLSADLVISSGPECGDGTIDPGEDCDGGDCCTGGCLYVSQGSVCRNAVGLCDEVEHCTGASADCPDDALVDEGVECRAVAGDCDVPEFCSGFDPACPADDVLPDTELCRGATNECDVDEFCNGLDGACPADACADAGLTCDSGEGPGSGECDGSCECVFIDPCADIDCTSLDDDCAVGVCNPVTFECEQQVLEQGTVCRASLDPCDVDEVCDGASSACPDDDCVTNGSSCFGGAGECTDCVCFITATCATHEDCADLDDDGVRDDNCIWWACVSSVCEATPVVFADLGGQFGVCPPDGTADGNDRFHALNCFSNTDPNTPPPNDYNCEAAAPAAFNVDAGGQFGSCSPDGVCDGNDAFAALNAFGNVSTCSCPLDGGPAPEWGTGFQAASRVVGRTSLSLVTGSSTVRPGERFDVEVYMDQPLSDLRGYQLHLGVFGGHRGELELIDISIHPREGTGRQKAHHVFEGTGYWDAYNIVTAQMVAGLDAAGRGVESGGYLATFTYRASKHASGRFAIEVLHDDADPSQRTFLFATPANGENAIDAASPAYITVNRRR